MIFGRFDRFRATLRLWTMTFPVSSWAECRKTTKTLLDALEKRPELAASILRGTKKMGTKHTEKCLENSADDEPRTQLRGEPVFTLCARDRAAPAAVRDWAMRAGLLGAPSEKTGAAYRIAVEMETWQQENPDRVKVPD